ncbi:hypothetical protein [Synechococcus sp. W60.2]|uniref:slr1601 family putative cell division protein n=1 Tax=Synechococcus sp. W60.2 TaxID=2964521 RepID=UPI0039C4D4CD
MAPKSASRTLARSLPLQVEQVAGPRLRLSSRSQGSLARVRGQGTLAANRRTIPVRPSRTSPRLRRRPEPQAWELLCRIGVNLLFTAAALGGLYRLLPVQLAQHHRLKVLEQNLEVLSARISRLREELDRGMDPLQQQALIKERLNRVPPDQIQVRLVDPSDLVADAEKKAPPTWIGQSPQLSRRP